MKSNFAYVDVERFNFVNVQFSCYSKFNVLKIEEIRYRK